MEKVKQTRNRLDLTGRRFGKLVVIERNFDRDSSHGAYWNCKCDCGNYACVTSYYLTSGRAKSCGCIGRGMAAKLILESEDKISEMEWCQLHESVIVDYFKSKGYKILKPKTTYEEI